MEKPNGGRSYLREIAIGLFIAIVSGLVVAFLIGDFPPTKNNGQSGQAPEDIAETEAIEPEQPDDLPSTPTTEPVQPTPIPPTATPIPEPIDISCPSTEDAKKFTNLNVTPELIGGVAWEPCMWTWHASGSETAKLTLPPNWSATVSLKGEGYSRLYLGEEGLTLEVIGFTLRYLLPYPSDHWVHDPQQFWQKEWDYSPTCPGNFIVEMTDEQNSVCN